MMSRKIGGLLITHDYRQIRMIAAVMPDHFIVWIIPSTWKLSAHHKISQILYGIQHKLHTISVIHSFIDQFPNDTHQTNILKRKNNRTTSWNLNTINISARSKKKTHNSNLNETGLGGGIRYVYVYVDNGNQIIVCLSFMSFRKLSSRIINIVTSLMCIEICSCCRWLLF